MTTLNFISSDRLRRNPAPGQKLLITDEQIDSYRASGAWPGRTVRSLLTIASTEQPERLAVVDCSRDKTTPIRVTYRDLDAISHRAALALDHLGVRSGDPVAVMMPNRLEFTSAVFGISEIGAIYLGIPVAYGERELVAILQRSKATVMFISRRWRNRDILALVRQLRHKVPTLETLIVDDHHGFDLIDGEVLWSALQQLPDQTFPEQDAAKVAHLGFTSGTTGEPKGVMNTHDGLVADIESFVKHIGHVQFGEPIVQLVASPMGHHNGFLWGILMTTYLQGTGVYVDKWDPQEAARIIRNEQVTAMVNAPTFLQDLMRTDLVDDPECPLKIVVIAGAPVPRDLPDKASKALGAYICPAWGMTECGIASACSPRLPNAILKTDGAPVQWSELVVVDAQESPVGVGVVGELMVRGPILFLGYFDRADETARSFTKDGWFRTGDRAFIDENGYVTLQGRSKDIIIRGGENVPVVEVESILFNHPDIINVAVVGYPDERLGERAAAVVVLRPGSTMTLTELSEYLLSMGLSRQYLPEKLDVREMLPMTMSGKTQKFQLREELAKRIAKGDS